MTQYYRQASRSPNRFPEYWFYHSFIISSCGELFSCSSRICSKFGSNSAILSRITLARLALTSVSETPIRTFVHYIAELEATRYLLDKGGLKSKSVEEGGTVEVDERAAAARVRAALQGALQLRAEVPRQLLLVHVAQLCNTASRERAAARFDADRRGSARPRGSHVPSYRSRLCSTWYSVCSGVANSTMTHTGRLPLR